MRNLFIGVLTFLVVCFIGPPAQGGGGTEPRRYGSGGDLYRLLRVRDGRDMISFQLM